MLSLESQRVFHTRKSSSIYKHYNLQHNSEMPERFIEQFHTITKCSGKFDCLVKEILYIRTRKPTLKVQTDSNGFHPCQGVCLGRLL